MSATQVEIGYNKRCWAVFTVKDATAEETAILSREGDTDEVTDLLRHLDAEERLIFISEKQDDNPTYVQEWDEPHIVEFWGPEDER